MKYLSYDDKYWAIDIETDDLNATVIWCMGYENIVTKQKGMCIGNSEIRKFFDDCRDGIFVTHNGLKFDAPVLNRLAGTRIPVSRIVDTLVLSTLYNPSIPEGHSLDAWGVRLGNPKIHFNDWSHLSEEMVEYCHQDVTVTADLYRRLSRVLLKCGFSEKTCEIQHKITSILKKQQENGFYFDGERAMLLYQKLRTLEERIKDKVHEAFPAQEELVRDRGSRVQSGGYCAQYYRDSERYRIEEYDDGTRYRAFESVSFNLGSPSQRVEKLVELGWENLPDEVTKGGSPKPFDKGDLVPSLKKFLEENPVPEVEMIARWMAYNGRANMVNTWLENWNEQDSCIHGKLFVADTLRFRHQAPNTANIPAVRVLKDGRVLYGEDGYFTYEARDLWTARPGRVLVGTDAAGLELRMLAHYLNREDFTKQVVEGDPHQYNADTVGISRPNAKTLLYAIMYGASGGKIGKTLNVSKEEGTIVRQQFLDRLGIAGLMQEAQDEQKHGRVLLVDGAGVICPSAHSALNYKLQGGGARVMAQAAIFLDGHIRTNGLDCLKVGDIHDEWQYDVRPSDARRHAELSVQSIREAGEELNFNVPLDGTAKEGRTWAETH